MNAEPVARALRRVGSPLLLATASSCATLAAVELALGLFHPIPFSIEVNMYFEPDPHTGYRIKPGSRGQFPNDAPAVANRWGHRDDDVSLAKPPGTTRILALGDSFTLGASVRQEDAWPSILERSLAGNLGHVEVIDAAVGGWGPFQYAAYHEHQGYRFGADMTLVGFFVGNDTYDPARTLEDLMTAVEGRRIDRTTAQKQTTRPLVFLYQRSHLTRLLLTRGPVRGEIRRRSCADFTRQYLAIQASRLSAHRRETPELRRSARENVQLVARISHLTPQLIVVLIPDENQINPELLARILPNGNRSPFDLEMPQSMLRRLFEEEDIPVIDLLAAFRQDPRCLYMNDTHWTPQGHRLAASLIAPEVSRMLRNP